MACTTEWTTRKPTESGWYWYQSKRTRPGIVFFSKPRKLVRWVLSKVDSKLDDLDTSSSEWQAPLTPEE